MCNGDSDFDIMLFLVVCGHSSKQYWVQIRNKF